MTTRIIGTGSYIPELKVSNEDLSEFLDTSDEWISTRTGIKNRHISTGITVCEMAVFAASQAMEKAGVTAEDIDLILLATSTADNQFPPGACTIQGMLNAKRAVAYDISAACSGFIFAVNMAHAFFQTGQYKTALIIGSEHLSKVTDWTDRSTAVLFGDGAGAAVLRAEDSGKFAFLMGSDGTRTDVLCCKGRPLQNHWVKNDEGITPLFMDGQAVFKFAIKKIPEIIEDLLTKEQISKEDIRYFLLHQANRRIITAAAKKLDIPLDRFPINIDQVGNTSAASLPILLNEMNLSGLLDKGDKLVLVGFGAGLTWGAVLIEW